MPAVNKVGTQLLVRPEIRVRTLALATVRQETHAETTRVLIEQALPRMEHDYQLQLLELRAALTKMGVEFVAGLEAMALQRIKFQQLFNSDGTAKRTFPGKRPEDPIKA